MQLANDWLRARTKGIQNEADVKSNLVMTDVMFLPKPLDQFVHFFHFQRAQFPCNSLQFLASWSGSSSRSCSWPSSSSSSSGKTLAFKTVFVRPAMFMINITICWEKKDNYVLNSNINNFHFRFKYKSNKAANSAAHAAQQASQSGGKKRRGSRNAKSISPPSGDVKKQRSPTSVTSSPVGGKAGKMSFNDERDEEYFCLRPVNPPASTFTNRSDDSEHNPDVIPDAFLGGKSRLLLYCCCCLCWFC